MKILITGASGLVGSPLVQSLSQKGHEVVRLVRHQKGAKAGEIYWNPMAGSLDKSALEGLKFDAVIHLAGENIAGGRWNEDRKKRIRDSRIKGTRVLAESLAHLQHPPHRSYQKRTQSLRHLQPCSIHGSAHHHSQR